VTATLRFKLGVTEANYGIITPDSEQLVKSVVLGEFDIKQAAVRSEYGSQVVYHKSGTIFDRLAKAASVPPGAARAFAQRKAVEQNRVMLFENLDGLGL